MVALCFTAIGSALLIIECVAIGFILSAAATVLSAIGLYATSRKDNARKGQSIAFWTSLINVGFRMFGGKRCLGPRKDLISHEFRQTNHRSPMEVGFARVIDAGHLLPHAP